MKTVITELLGIEYPVIQGGMAWVGTAELAAAVSEAGGLGIIGAGGAPASWVEEQIHKVKEKTDKPFGVNLMLLNPEADAIAELLVKFFVLVVFVLIWGRPTSINFGNKYCPAVLAAGYPGAQGGLAIAEALKGDYTPGG